jgi:acetyl-CoA hydrolase
MVTINSVIEVDLTGQVCSDSIGPRIYSGVGGQMDFIYRATLSDGGMPVITMMSAAKSRDGAIVNRIVPMLRTGAGVTTSRNHVHFVVTEFGIVNLYGKSIRQRAELLISIAHPNFRDELKRGARALKYL